MRLTAAQAQGSRETVYAATFAAVDETGKRWAHCAREAGWGLESQIQVVADGAEWIRRQAGRIFGDQHHLLCDLYQASESLAAAAKCIRPAQSERWRHTQQRRLKRGAASRVIAELAAHGEPPDPPKENAPVTDAHRYLRDADFLTIIRETHVQEREACVGPALVAVPGLRRRRGGWRADQRRPYGRGRKWALT